MSQARGILAVESIRLNTLYVLLSIELRTRRAHLAGATANPDSGWVTQSAQNLTMTFGGVQMKFLIHDRDAKVPVRSTRWFRVGDPDHSHANPRSGRQTPLPSAGSRLFAPSASTGRSFSAGDISSGCSGRTSAITTCTTGSTCTRQTQLPHLPTSLGRPGKGAPTRRPRRVDPRVVARGVSGDQVGYPTASWRLEDYARQWRARDAQRSSNPRRRRHPDVPGRGRVATEAAAYVRCPRTGPSTSPRVPAPYAHRLRRRAERDEPIGLRARGLVPESGPDRVLVSAPYVAASGSICGWAFTIPLMDASGSDLCDEDRARLRGCASSPWSSPSRYRDASALR